MSILLFVIMIACVLYTGIIFSRRDEKWWKTLIPGYNRYVFGKLCNAKTLGAITGLIKIVWDALLVAIYTFEVWIAQHYAVGMYDATRMMIEVPAEIKDQITALRITMIIVAAVYIFVWSLLMYKFSNMHGKKSYWIALWAICPVIPLHYFAFSNTVAMYGNVFTYERVPVHKNMKKAEKTSLARRK